MSKRRQLDTRFWDDEYVSDLDPSEKLLFLYLLTNPLTNIAGFYEITIRRISFDTGFDGDMVRKMIKRFEDEKKLVYVEGHIFLVNFMKHQSLNPSVLKGVSRCLGEIPQRVWKAISASDVATEALHSMSEARNIDLPTELEQSQKVHEMIVETPAQYMRELIAGEKRQEFLMKFENRGIDRSLLEAELNKFLAYWTEPTKSGRKQNWETKRTFEATRRFATWLSNVNKFSKTINTNKPKILRE